MSKYNLAKNSFLYSIGIIVPQAAAFFLLPLYLNYLSPSDYGILNSIQVISSALTIIYTLSIDKAVYRLYFDYKNVKSKKDFLGTVFISISVISILITSFIYLFPEILGSIYSNISFYPYISLGVIGSFLATFIILPRSIFLVKEKANYYIILTISEFFLRNLFIVVFVVFLSKGVEGYLHGQILGSLILFPFLIYITFRQINFIFIRQHIIAALKYSIPMLPTFISVWIISSIDIVFIERYFDVFEVGIYSLGYKIAMSVTIISSALYKAYSPYYFKLATTGIKSIVLTELKNTNTIYLILIIFTASLIALFSKEIIFIFFDEQYYDAYKIVMIVSIAFAISSFGGIFNLAIYQEKKTIFLMYINLFSALINIILNFLLIPFIGVLGAAIATMITYLVTSLSSFYYAKKCFYASFDSKIVIIIILAIISINLFFLNMDLGTYYAILFKLITLVILSLIIWKKYKLKLLEIFLISSK